MQRWLLLVAVLALCVAALATGCASSPATAPPQASGTDAVPTSTPVETNDLSAAAATVRAPSRGDFWTVIIASLQASSVDEQAALSRTAEAQAVGLDALCIRSGDYPSLKPGFWVVCVGEWPDSATAMATLAAVRSKGFPSAYVRHVQSLGVSPPPAVAQPNPVAPVQQARHKCPICDGRGFGKCFPCRGTGRSNCTSCGGRGQIKCIPCGGRGFQRCTMCQGTGFNSLAGARCVTCQGTGLYRCSSCLGSGGFACNSCNGAGWTDCGWCQGSGREECITCGGTGFVS